VAGTGYTDSRAIGVELTILRMRGKDCNAGWRENRRKCNHEEVRHDAAGASLPGRCVSISEAALAMNHAAGS
jgi:hypothetical protein